MAADLVETKLHAPRSRAGLVHRPRLAERLARGASSKLTLGKSTLVADWLAYRGSSNRAAWLSLDPADNDPLLFLRYVVAALRTIGPDASREAEAVLESSDPGVERALHSLLYGPAASDDDLVLVLDDFHVVDRREIHDAVAYLIDRLPANVHLVITTRADPALPLARLRARGDLVEIRAADLRFTRDDVAAYLGTMGPRSSTA